MKKYSDKTERIIMSNGNVMEVKYKSELLGTLTPDFSLRMMSGRFMSSC